MSNRQDDWNSATQSLFQAARRVHDPSASDRARVDAALASQLTAAEVAHLRTAASSSSLRTPGAQTMLKLAFGAVCVAAAILGITFASVQRAEPAPRAQLPAPSPAGQPPASAVPQTLAAPEARKLTHALETRARAPRRRVQALAPQTPARELKRPRTGLETATRVQAASGLDIDHSQTAEPAHTLLEKNAPDDAQPRAAASEAAPAQAHAAVSPQPAADGQSSHAATPREQRPNGARTEMMLVADMHAALKRADFSAALALCTEHQRLWPRGVFTLEREGVRAIATCGKRASEAGSLAQHFLAEHPNAPLAMRVRYACASQLAASRAP